MNGPARFGQSFLKSFNACPIHLAATLSLQRQPRLQTKPRLLIDLKNEE
jgi:hypothetical protein